MAPGISIINIIIIVGLIAMAYLGYTQYLDNKIKQELNSVNNINQPAISEKSEPTITSNPPVKNQAAVKKTAPEPAPTPKTDPIVPPPNIKKGYYKNETYFYELIFPENWPIKIRSPENISFGTVPPRDGQGAITIEITQGESNELEQAKEEAKKYPGLIKIYEESITLAGISGDKIILNNLVANTKTINILIKKSGYNYIVKYGEESPEFVDQVNKSLATFKFFK